ncbi:hypothetical protein NH340_JMT06210 [Sarcoptes scabiei]|uniref:Carnitine-acylcarnitine carrier protein-like protein n=1 Tax=Sarcoptes scabiei TaxID=52283 RepID=A0A132AHY2_SARSC|nr:carnitine-acylcarnitine carrier protein-like protein [Sarcoptes scabiei]UXI20267.1 hypothetical protein NH340_JMT06210 [Sarcoptes scabiei]
MAVDSLDNLITSFKQFFSGGIGGICLILAGHPMDTIKVRLQTMPTPKAGERPQYSGMIDCMTKTIHHEGFQGFYRGMVAPLIAATPINAVCFFGFGLGVSLFNGSPDAVDTLSSFQLFQAGMLSGAFTATINTPTERIKCLMQIEQGSKKNAKYKNFWDCTKKVYAQGGIRSVYKGLIPTFSRDIPGSGAYFLSYEYLKQNGSNIFHLKNENARTLLAGGLAGICYWLVAIPADVIKSRIQTAPDGKYNRLLDAIRYMYNRNGLTSFYKGTAPVLVRAFPANAACFFGYEYSMKLLSLIL